MQETKVLIIDDEEKFGEIVKMNLEGTGEYQVKIETKGRRALYAARRFKPDIILLDIRMPDKNGFEVLEELKKNKKTVSIPVVMITVTKTESAKIRAMQLYSEGYLTKPLTVSSIKTKIESVLRSRKGGDRFMRYGIIPEEDLDVEKDTKEVSAPAIEEKYKSDQIKVLIVEDEKSECDLIKELLTSRGFKVFSCWNPKEAIKVFSKLKPDILLLDLIMPKINGMEILNKIKELKTKVKIIVLTAVKDPLVIKDAMSLGANDVIIKPYTMDQVHVAIIKVLRATNKER